jgi:hypothetical protein
MAYTSPRYAIGTELPVFYQPAKPTEARIATFLDNWLGASIAGAIGLISLVVGFLVRGSRSAPG